MSYEQLRDMLRERKRQSGAGTRPGWDEMVIVHEYPSKVDGEDQTMCCYIIEIGDRGLSLRDGRYIFYSAVIRVTEDVMVTRWGKPPEWCEVSPLVAEGVRYVVERSASLALDDESDREALIEVMVPELLSFLFTGEPGNMP